MKNNSVHKRKINTVLGLCGLLGLLGPIMYSYTQEPFMIVFTGFIGFFGFLFANKIPYDEKNESFISNENKAKLLSTRYAFIAIIICMIISFRISDIKSAYVFLIEAISVIWGLTIIVNQYLLYLFMKQK